jgi:hypothetical protein
VRRVKRSYARALTFWLTAPMLSLAVMKSHSVRGFLAGVVRKKLGLALQSEMPDGERVYRVIACPDSSDHG